MQDVDKVELHCHLDGLIDPAMLAELARRGVPCPVTPAALAAQVPVRSARSGLPGPRSTAEGRCEVQSIAQWMGVYTPLVAPCMTAVTRPPILEIHIENLIRQRVVYAELMVSGLLGPPRDDGEVVAQFLALREAADRASRGVIEIVLLVAIGRGPIARAQRQAERILLLARHALIAGVAIAGDETACTIESLAGLLARFRDAGLGIEIHAGETAGPESVREALAHGRPDRLGHAITAFEDERLVDELQRRDVHLEMCPTSNLCLGVVADLARHPIARARERGMNFSINTDDPGPFGCTMTSELAAVEHAFGFTRADFEQIRANAWRSRFSR